MAEAVLAQEDPEVIVVFHTDQTTPADKPASRDTDPARLYLVILSLSLSLALINCSFEFADLSRVGTDYKN